MFILGEMAHLGFLSLCIFLCWLTSHVTVASAEVESSNITGQEGSSDPEFPWPHYRLPTTYSPSHYELFFYPHPENDTFLGLVTMDLLVSDWSDWVIMNQYMLNISRVVAQSMNKVWVIKNYMTSDDFQILAIKLPEGIPRSSGSITLTIHFTGWMRNKDGDGFFKGNYMGPDGKTKRPMYLTNAGTASARKLMPCFDEPAFKAKFTMKIVRPMSMISLSNMPLAESGPFKKDLVIDKFETSPKMAPNDLGFVICDFVPKTAYTKGGTRVSVYAPEYFINKTEIALKVHIMAIDYLEQLFQIHYPLPKLDLTMSDSTYGSGSWGLMVYYTKSEFFEAVSDIRNMDIRHMKDSMIFTNIANQWIGSLVTGKFWNEVWLTYGIAQFVSYYACNKLFPTWNTTKNLITGFRDYQMDSDSFPFARPIRFDVENPDNYSSVYSNQMQFKGALMTNFLFNVLGEEKFLTALREYLKKYSYESVDEESFLDIFNKHAAIYGDHPLGDFVSSFTNQAGLPLLTVQKTKNGLLQMSQKRFFINHTEPSNQTWNVLISVAFDSGRAKYLTLFDQSQVFNLNVSSYKWYKLNMNNTGFYRVNYDEENWQALLNQLIENKDAFSSVDRYGIFIDMFKSAKHKTINVPKVFKFLNDYAGKEDDRRCLYLLAQEVGAIGVHLASTPVYDTYKNYAKHVFQNANDMLNWSLVLNDRFTEWHSAYILGLLAYYDLGHLRKDAYEMVYNYVFNKVPNRAFEYRRSFICGSALLYDQMLWDPIFELYLESENPEYKQAYFKCLFYGNDSSKIFALIDSAKDDSSFIYTVTNSIFSLDSKRVDYYWSYYTETFDKFINELPLGNFTHFSTPLYYINTEKQFDQVKEFFSSKNITEDKAVKVVDIFETIEGNIETANFFMKAFQGFLNMWKN